MAGTVALAAALLLGACSDDTFREGRDDSPWAASDHICFGISETGTSRTTRAAGGAEERTTGNFVLRGEGTADTLCMRAYVTDGIEGAALGEKGAATRAAQVTAMDTYASFKVLAYWKKNDEPVTSTFFMDETVKYANNVWSTENPHYWPGSGHKLSFYAWAPASIEGPNTPNSYVLKYEVPENVNDVVDEQGNVSQAGQKDVVVAVVNDMAGNSYQAVQLKFDHICTAVRFVVGSEMQAGTIKRITLKNIKYKGEYNMSAESWTLEKDAITFSQELDKQTAASDAAGTAITDANNGYFMMLPQKFDDEEKEAVVEVAFEDAVTGNERTLSASIKGQEWQKGTTVTYKLSITPDYTVELEGDNENVVDAHYVIHKATLKISGIAADATWEITAPEIGGEQVTIQLQNEMNEYAKEGYWTDDAVTVTETTTTTVTRGARGKETLTGTGPSELEIAVFIPENTGEESRTISLPVKVNDVDVQPLKITQLSPCYNTDGVGCERIEDEEKYPWGFLYDRKVTYTKNTLLNLTFGWFFTAQFDVENLSYVDYSPWDIQSLKIKVVIDYSLINSLDEANDNDGLENTKYLYTYSGSGNIFEVENFCDEYTSWFGAGSKLDKVIDKEGEQSSTYAVMEAIMKNKFDLTTYKQDKESYNAAILAAEDIHWYLPSTTECTSIKDTDYPLKNEYWTSNRDESDNTKAYYFAVDGGTVTVNTANRVNEEDYKKIRAVRKKPTATE